ncbi:AAA family ATPase [Paracoccus sp. MC1854]|uniref:AAA family ATPase n=1 Tax=Paracoccus sp. MC1854 TaxID=2760306 RepID=UPI002101EED3|nr:AAA family ATPase [Paracoccus sp. MC1854]
MLIVDEADRLSIASLEHMRDLYDRYGFGLILMGMPGLEKKFARYPQLYSRIGFVHEFKPLREAEMRLVAARHGAVFGIIFDQESLGGIEAPAAVIRLTRGNLRLAERLLAQMRRIMDINAATEVTLEVVEAARDRLVIGPGD